MSTPNNGTTVSISNTPQAKDDAASGVQAGQLLIDVMANDLGGNAKHLYSVNQASPTVASLSATTALGGTVSIVGDQIQYAATGAQIASLGVGQIATDTFNYVIQLGNGALSVATVTLKVTGTNDAPTLSADPVAHHALSEIAGVTGGADVDAATGTLAFADVDLNDHHTLSIGAPSIVWSAGTGVPAATASALASALTAAVSTDSTGTGAGAVGFNFSVADKQVDFLAAGQTLTVTYNVTVSDGHGGTASQPVSFTITGTNDGPVAVADTAATTENQPVTVDVLANDTDVDDGATHSLVSASAPAGQGVASVLNGKLAFTPGTDFDHLAQGATQTVTLTYVMSDDQGAQATSTVTLVVTGTNDAPVVSPIALAATEGQPAASSVDALSTASDVDDGAHLTVVGVPAGLPAGVSYDAASHSFSLNAADPAYDHLAAGDTQTVTVAYGVSDGLATTPTSVSWTITGTNDAPVVSGAVTGAATEAGAGVTLNGLANASDVDDHTTLSIVNVPPTLPAGVSYDAASHSFTLDPTVAAYDHLAAGATQVVSVTYEVSDGTAHTAATASWTITGTNDAPVATPLAFHVLEGGPASPPVNALSTASDVDDGAQLSVVGLPTTLPAGVAYDAASHSFSFDTTDPAYNHLAQGDTQVVTVSYGVTDGDATTPTSISWTVTGTNDAPVAGPVSGDATEGGAVVTLNALANASDVDDHTTLSVGQVVGNLPPGVSFDAATQSFSLDPTNAAYNHLAAGATQSISVLYTVTDGMSATPTTASWTIHGTNDAPTVDPINVSSAEGGDLLQFNATLGGHDADDGAVLSAVAPGPLPAGVSYNPIGSTFQLNPADAAFDHLATGETQVVSFTYGVTDGQLATPETVNWTVTGTNDAPVLAAQVSNLVQNGDFSQGAAHWTDPSGGPEIGNTGTYGVSPSSDGAVLELDSGYNVDDVSQTVATAAGTAYTFSFDAANRAGTSAATNAFQVLWNGQVIDTVTPGSTAFANHSYTVIGNGAVGKVEFREINNDSLGGIIDNVSLKPMIVEAAGQTGSTALDTLSATLAFTDLDLSDHHTASVGGPTISFTGAGAVPADLAAALTGAVSTSVTEASGAGSVLASFAAPDKTFDFMHAGDSLTVTYNVTIDDGHGGTSVQPVSFTIQGTNDAPAVAAPIADQSVNMLQPFSFTVPGATFTDPDSSLTYTAHLADGSALPSWLTFNAATETFSGTPQGADVGTLAVVVTASDGSLQASDTFNLGVNIVNQTLVGTASAETLTGSVGADTLSGFAGNDTLLGGAGADAIYGDATGAAGPAATASFQLSAVAAADLVHDNTLVVPTGGVTTTLPANDDGSSAPINITSIFGAAGLNFFGADYTTLYVNNNGNITFGAANASYTPTSITAGNTPIIAPFWGDVDTRGGATAGSPNTVSYNLDSVNGVFTVTWDHVGYYADHTSPSDTFQLQLINEGNGDFDIIFRYQQIGWLSGDANAAGNYARAGFNSGSGVEYELPGSGTSSMLSLPTQTNTVPQNSGVFEMFVRAGVVVSNADVLDGGAGHDTLTGGSGPDTFVFHAGEGNGDTVVDFSAGDGDKLNFVGYGAGATFTQIDSTHWQVNYGAGQHDVITFQGAPPINTGDYSFFTSSLL
jgi:VCBS repeat-containing protein